MSLLLAMTGWHVEDWRARFQALLPEMPIVVLGEPFDRRAVHYVASWKHPAGSLTGLPNLAAIFSLGAGVDFLFADDKLPEVPIARVVDPDLTTRMSEYVVLHCLMYLRQQHRYMRQQQAKLWEDDRNQPAARSVRVGIMGLGELGLDAAAKLKLIGFDVAGWSRSPKSAEGLQTFSGEDGLKAFLARTDILVSLVPLTPQTRGILNAELFAGLARDGRLGGPFLINPGRGGLQVADDIVAALDAGTLKGATLDVFETEPLPVESPLWSHPGVTITPHNAAMSEPEAIASLVAAQIRRLEAGEPLLHAVDPARGY
ncbi:MAG: glyoxylate/hydroxypyruvate reductase A [Bosea sp.]|uniref:2-hydroxyacid dehydrogenase n=1 Tax=unclassified Bosea (in: a-proteobacteria) TaxID=2653178 RepID=UPI0009684C3F|nr:MULTISPECIES: glyoxylate/hydroxypyruvate reductase A [unclassified Bosea (in: a-proteobacteria)]MBN9444104.1 glyoxylate/hydroxypyruvate reductase A [Bosea sp. (in: a-proteobacteria)]MBN9457834.1 glyoxylate/hydroxypyruvate reductase A [Bosea sp. (in: a-proteobacteria)]OJV10381.1 MAG: glyoxylate/hydroxypyruvate reductase A [Bosea sp. 67-29]